MDAVAVTAPTGIAACNIGGTTLHSFAGLGIKVVSKQQAAADVERRPASAKRWKDCAVLIIDEVGLLGGVVCFAICCIVFKIFWYEIALSILVYDTLLCLYDSSQLVLHEFITHCSALCLMLSCLTCLIMSEDACATITLHLVEFN